MSSAPCAEAAADSIAVATISVRVLTQVDPLDGDARVGRDIPGLPSLFVFAEAQPERIVVRDDGRQGDVEGVEVESRRHLQQDTPDSSGSVARTAVRRTIGQPM